MSRIIKMSVAILLLLVGRSYVLKAQCSAGCSSTTEFKLNEVVLCHKGACGDKDGKHSFSISRSASLSTTVTFRVEGFTFCIDPSEKIYIDFGDGSGFFQALGASIVINYPPPNVSDPSANIKKIRVRRGASDVIYETDFMIKSPAGAYISPDFVKRIETPTVFDPATQANATVNANMFPANGAKFMAKTKGVGHAYVRCSPHNFGKIKKPIIFVDGIDFDSEDKNFFDPALGSGNTDANVIRHGATGWDVFVTGAEDGYSKSVPNAREDFRDYPNVFQNLWDKGYDIVFLDFVEGATWIQKNAQVLKATLLWINEEKAKNGSSFENVIVGPSMGGQVARIALAEMERDGVNHCTKMYVSFDSPHQGAHIPLALQSMAWSAFDSNFSCSLWTKLNAPAARQLLTYHLANEMGANRVQMTKTHIKPPINTGLLPILVKASQENDVPFNVANDGGNIRTGYMSYLNQLGYPKQTNNLAIADGNISGLPQAATSSQKIFDGSVHVTTNASFVVNTLQGIGQALPFPLSLIQPKFTVSPSVVTELGITAEVVGLQALTVLPIGTNTYQTLNDLVPNSRKRLIDVKMYALPGTNAPLGTFNYHGAGTVLAVQTDFLHLNYKPTVGDNTIFELSIPVSMSPPAEFYRYHAKINPSAVGALLNLDNVPGAGRSDLVAIEDILKKEGDVSALGIKFAKAGIGTTIHRSPLNFISTFSALDVQEPMTNMSLTSNTEDKIDKKDFKIPFEDYYGPNGTNPNLNHVEVNQAMRDKVLQWLNQYEEDLLLVGKLPAVVKGINQSTYNYGLWRKRIPSTNINAGGVLRVNNEGPSAFLNEGAATKPVFETYLSGCGGSIVNINDGGKFIIGSDAGNKQGIVKIPKSSVLNINIGGQLLLQKASQITLEYGGTIFINGGTTNLKDGSKITIEIGGRVFINGGTTALKDGSQIVIKKGGQLTIKAGASININDNSQIIVEVGGQLILEKGVGNQLAFNGVGSGTSVLVRGELIVNTPIKMNGTAYFDFASGNKVTLLNTFEFTGQSKTQKMINLQENATLSLQNQSIVVRNGNITYGNYSKIILPASKIADLMDIGFSADVTSIATTGLTNIGGVSPQILRISNCRVFL